MNTLYFECHMGASGDMLLGALLELTADPEAALAQMNALGLPGVRYQRQLALTHAVAGTHVRVRIRGQEEITEDLPSTAASCKLLPPPAWQKRFTIADVEGMVGALRASAGVKRRVMEVYQRIAAAESLVHGEPVGDVHLHALGTMDALADIAGSCLLLEALSPQQILASPIHVGAGTVCCAGRVFPVPAPATAVLLQGVPFYGGAIQGELCTPTGAALLRSFSSDFCPQPAMCVERVGCGLGSKEFSVPSMVRAFLGVCA